MPTCALLAIGSELLNGEVRDANIYTLSQRFTSLGLTVAFAVITRDQEESIISSLHFLLRQAPNILVITGGLGPTDDDLTLRVLARALERPLLLNAEAQRLVEDHYLRLARQGYLRDQGPESARLKMSQLPAGATPLPNPIGTAPGVRLVHDGTVLYVLPGVPAEMEAILEQSVLPELTVKFGAGAWSEAWLIVKVDDEAKLARPLREVAQRHPDVYLKSLAQPFPTASQKGLKVIAAAHAPNSTIAAQATRAALQDLQRVLERLGLQIVSAGPGTNELQNEP